MIKLVVNGGLGNQLFQMAAAYHVSSVSGLQIQLDVSEMAARKAGRLPGTARELHLTRVFPQIEAVTDSTGNPAAMALSPGHEKLMLWNLARPRLIEERYELMCATEVRMKGNWQSWQEYSTTFFAFSSMAKKAFDSLASCDEPSLEPSSVAMHMRFGDYLGSSKYRRLGPSYFERALNSLTPLPSNLIICSDDTDKARQLVKDIHVEFKHVAYFSSVDAIQDFNRLRLAKSGFVGSNSTFSWWAAALGQAEKVVMPRSWFTLRSGRSSRDYWRSDWQQI